MIAGASTRNFVAIPAWGDRLRRLCPRARPVEWLPIPSNIPTGKAATDRSRVGIVIGHFGTYGPATADLVAATLPRLLAGRPERSALLLGRGGAAFRSQLVSRIPELGERLIAPGELAADELAARLRGCDVLLQPFIDGISTRRGSAMAALANAVPLVSNLGELSEPLWADLGWPTLSPTPDPVRLAAATEALLDRPASERMKWGRCGAALYRTHFSLDTTLARLRTPERRTSR
jgi:glycosyltransferase involved in cell wall biosynthesis